MQRISGTSRLAGVIGNPLAHSLSPAMHNAVYEHLGLDWVYVPLEVAGERGLERLIGAVRELPFVGLSVTMPFKQAVIALCDEVSTAAAMAGSVNTLHCTDGRLIGYTTDGRGLLEALADEARFDPAGRDVVVLGAGGAASSALVSLALAGISSVTVVNRSVARAETVLRGLSPHLGDVRVQAVSFAEAEEPVRAADLVVNATPIGMDPADVSPIESRWLGPGQVVYDMVYGTREPTALVREAQEVGAAAFDGLGMLVSQGAIAVDIWNEVRQERTPRGIMRAAAEEALAQRPARG